jgi:hypothetical protein
MQREPRLGPTGEVSCAFPPTGRVRPEELLRRKMMQKMIARRARRLAHGGTLVRRIP